MSKPGVKKDFSEGERVTWELSPYNYGFGRIRGKVEGIPDLIDTDWWIVQLENPEGREPHKVMALYPYSCIVVPSYN